ncbi:MAG: sensor histidine kinase [Clostridia bacterium]|nr:sensor histidine kinase [Clostridia bacterium]
MSKKIPFNVNAYTARLIGRENVSTLDGAILELVKNTYDADATKCVLYYEETTKTLYLMDNGSGMTEDVIEKHWMTIGNSSKYKRFITSIGRVQTGAKGIGRFALDRIGDTCVMYTKNDSFDDIIEWKVDWRDFNREDRLTDITAEINYKSNTGLSNMIINVKNSDVIELVKKNFINTGTIFKIENLREEWNLDLINDIKQSLASLLPPDIENEFSIYFFKEKDIIKDSFINSKGVDTYDYKIQFETKENNVEIIIDRNEFDFGNKLDEIINNTSFTEMDKKYFLGESIHINKSITELVSDDIADDIGNFNGKIYFNKIKIQKDEKEKYFYKDIIGRKNYSDIFGGIKIYRDNFRVRPYGETKSSSYDWLLLGSRRAKSPAAISHSTGRWRVGAEQICGIINISRMNINLPDQSNRQGIVETKQFNGLKLVILAIINEFEKDRQYVGRILNSYYEKTHPKELIEQEIEAKVKREQAVNSKNVHLEDNSTMISASKVKIAMEQDKKKIESLETENCMLRNLATTGIVTNQYIHETKGNVNSIGLNITTAKDALIFKQDIDRAIMNLEKAQKCLENLNSWFDVTIDSIKRDKRNMKFTDINVLMNNQIEKWKVVLDNQNIDIKLDAEEIELFKCFPYEIESIISNLIANSVSAFRGIKDKKIHIIIKKINNGFEIIYKDTGKGLSEKYKNEPNKILEAFETDKMNGLNEIVGTGMGMWIIDTIVKRYQGEIDLEENKNLKQGFKIEISLTGNLKE